MLRPAGVSVAQLKFDRIALLELCQMTLGGCAADSDNPRNVCSRKARVARGENVVHASQSRSQVTELAAKGNSLSRSEKTEDPVDVALVRLGRPFGDVRMHVPEGGESFGKRSKSEWLDQVVHGSQLNGLTDRCDVTCGRDDDHGWRRRGTQKLTQHLEAVTIRKVDVHEHQLRMQRLRELARLRGRVSLCDDAESFDALNEFGVDSGDAIVVVNDQHADGVGVHRRLAGVFARVGASA